jgi:hypothetical protein
MRLVFVKLKTQIWKACTLFAIKRNQLSISNIAFVYIRPTSNLCNRVKNISEGISKRRRFVGACLSELRK